MARYAPGEVAEQKRAEIILPNQPTTCSHREFGRSSHTDSIAHAVC